MSIVGKQYMGGHNLEGIDVDTDTFVRDLLIPKEDNMPTLEELEAAIKKERTDRETGAAWLAAALAYHKADRGPHIDSARMRELDELYETLKAR